MDELIILYEDNHCIVVVKPQNIPSQEDSTGDMDMLTMVREYIREKYDKPGNVFTGLIHRLDRPTGGLMVFAKTSKAAARLCQQIKDGDFEKRYLAVTIGRPRDARGRLINYLVKDEANNMVKLSPAMVEDAKRAELDYMVLETYGKLSLIEIKLLTGRNHQARVQMSAQGCPILGDVKYGAVLGKGHNLALWAYSLKFEHPTTKQTMTFRVFPPEAVPWKYFGIAKYINVVKPE